MRRCRLECRINLLRIDCNGLKNTGFPFGPTAPECTVPSDPREKGLFNTCTYKKRDDINAVIHAHPHTSMVFGVAGVEIIPVQHAAVVFAPCVEIFDFPGQIDNEEMGLKVAEALKGNFAVLLRGHGVVVAGGTPEEACCNAFELEANVRIQLWASILGTPRAVTKEEIFGSSPEGKKKHRVASPWPYYLEKYGKISSR